MLRFVVLKGVCGFGDRLQCLLHAIHYAKSTDRYLVVDWRDDVWTHEASKNIEHYFRFEGLKHFHLDDFLSYFQEHKSELSVHPISWKTKIETPFFKDYLYRPIFMVNEKNDNIREISRFEKEDHDEDVVVLSGTGLRTFNYSDFRHIQPQRWVEDALTREFHELGLFRNGFDVVHLRGGDKSWQGGRHPIEEKRREYATAWPTRESYLDDVHQIFQNRLSDASLKAMPLVVLTDSRELGQAWIDRFSVGRLMENTFNTLSGASGTHELSKSHLEQNATSKERLNLEMLRDFNLIMNSRVTVHVGKSLFANMGQKIGDAGLSLVPLPSPPPSPPQGAQHRS